MESSTAPSSVPVSFSAPLLRLDSLGGFSSSAPCSTCCCGLDTSLPSSTALSSSGAGGAATTTTATMMMMMETVPSSASSRRRRVSLVVGYDAGVDDDCADEKVVSGCGCCVSSGGCCGCGTTTSPQRHGSCCCCCCCRSSSTRFTSKSATPSTSPTVCHRGGSCRHPNHHHRRLCHQCHQRRYCRRSGNINSCEEVEDSEIDDTVTQSRPPIHRHHHQHRDLHPRHHQHQHQQDHHNPHHHHQDCHALPCQRQQQRQQHKYQRWFLHDMYDFILKTMMMQNSSRLIETTPPPPPPPPTTTTIPPTSTTTTTAASRLSVALLVLASLCVMPASCLSRDRHVDPAAKQLHHDLMSTYNALVKPSGGPNNQLTVKMGLRLSQVLDVELAAITEELRTKARPSDARVMEIGEDEDEKGQIITISVWLRQEWSDLRLKWDPTDYGGVRKLNIPSDDLWKPDIVLYNNADGDFVVTLKTKATVHYNGKIVWEPPAIYKSYCPIDVEYFPFDIQECFMKFSSWTYHFDEVDLQHVCNGTRDRLVIPRGIDMKDYHYNVEWDVLNVTAKRNLKKYPCCKERYPDITFTIILRRRTLFYTLNLIMPCISISCLTVLVFYLPSDSGEKITLSISILLALTVFFLLLSDMNPPTSLVIPLIGKYLLFIMIVVVASIFLTVYSLHVNFKTPSTDKMSPWVKRIFTEILPKVLLMKRPDVTTGLSGGPPNTPPMGGASNKAPNGIEAPPEGGDWGPYENLRQRHESGESGASCSVDNNPPPAGPRFQPDVMNALKGLRYIADHLRQGDTDLAEERDWKYISMVIDRFFLFIFTTACFVGTLSIFLYAPSLYDPRNHLALVDPNSKCQY